MRPARGSLVTGALIGLHTVAVLGDGTGLIGYGKTLYNPTCAFACRGVVKGCRLLCTPAQSTANHGTAHSPTTTPPDCFVKDTAFLRTMALCLDTYCAISTNPALSLIEDYWASHLGTGTLGDYSWVPATSYRDALAAAREDERQLANSTGGNDQSQDSGDHSGHTKLRRRQEVVSGFMSAAGPNVTSPLPVIKASTPLNVTSFVAPKDWQKQYNGMLDFETNETGHSTYSIVVMLVAILIPVALSLLRFVPGIANSQMWIFIQSALILPAMWGKRHREPIAGGQVPTRGQALYIVLISVLNIVLLVGPYVHHHPQSTFVSLAAQELSIIGNRAGCMAMGNVVVLFIFAGRNNVLLYITDWSHGTYLLLHRWLGYWAVFHTVLHSVMLLGYYKVYGTYEAELAREYWRWGIVGTVAVSALTLSSLLVVRQRLYEFFLASHVVLSLLFIIGYYYHIWFLYKYSWGYEIWIFIAGGIWGVERLARLARMAWQGSRTATVTSIADTEGEYLRIDIEGVRLDSGVVYLCFPTLGWRFWETHPFSVAFSSDHDINPPAPLSASKSDTSRDDIVEKSTSTTTVTIPPKNETNTTPTTTFLVRVRTGITARLATRTSNPQGTRLTVLLEGPYPHDTSSSTAADLSHCTRLLYLAGGVGITALLPHLRQSSSSSARTARLVWSTRKAGLADALAPVLAGLTRGNVEVEVSVGVRADLDGVLEKELAAGAGEGLLGIVVCGPAGMADCVRHRVVQVARSGRATRGYVLVDEAYGW